MESVFIVSSSQQAADLLSGLLGTAGYRQTAYAKSGAEARRMLIDNDFGLILVNTPLTDEFGHELAISVSQMTTAGVMLLVKNEIADEVSARVEDYGVLVVAKPVIRPLFFQALKLVSAARNRIVGLQSENVRLQSKIEEIRLVDRAKCALIQYLNMTEPQAHRYIEKQAMDMRTTRREIAQNILKTYEV